jgi:copper chaperone
MCLECGCHKDKDTVVLRVEGMTCGHCKKSVENALVNLHGVTLAEVSLEDGIVKIDFDSATVGLDVIKDAISDAGYKVV